MAPQGRMRAAFADRSRLRAITAKLPLISPLCGQIPPRGGGKSLGAQQQKGICSIFAAYAFLKLYKFSCIHPTSAAWDCAAELPVMARPGAITAVGQSLRRSFSLRPMPLPSLVQ